MGKMLKLISPKSKGLTVEGGITYFNDRFYTDFNDGNLYIIKNDKRLRKKYKDKIGGN